MMKLSILSCILALASTGLGHPAKRHHKEEDKTEDKPKANITDVDILQYALTLEHLGKSPGFYHHLKPLAYHE
jgi:hypothetical protein